MKRLIVPATLQSLEQIRDYVSAAARMAGLDRKSAYCLRLGVDEIATNAITYGYAGRDGDNTLRVSAEIDDHTIQIIFEDRGTPYNPNAAPPLDDFSLPLEQRQPGGLGVYLTQRSIERLCYERAGDWNRITLIMSREDIP